METKCGKHSDLWIIGRIGILICFGIMPIMRSCERAKQRVKYDHFYECIDKANAATARKDWKESEEWLRKADEELKRELKRIK